MPGLQLESCKCAESGRLVERNVLVRPDGPDIVVVRYFIREPMGPIASQQFVAGGGGLPGGGDGLPVDGAGRPSWLGPVAVVAAAAGVSAAVVCCKG